MNVPGSADLLVTGGMLVTLDGGRRVIEDGAVAIREGQIVEVDKTEIIKRRHVDARQVGGPGFLVMPGLVDAHVHVTAEHLARSVAPDNAGSRWIAEWGLPLYGAVTPEQEHLGALLSCLEMIKNGTTAFCEGGTVHDMEAVSAAVAQAGVRGTLGLWTWDLSSAPESLLQSAESALHRTEEAIRTFHGTANGRVRVAATCIRPMFCSDELLIGLKELADRYGLIFTYHQSPFRESVDKHVADRGRRPLLDGVHRGILGPNVLASHMVHLEEEELEILVSSGASVAHCPQTCLRQGYGATAVGRFAEMLERGVTVALGTDGVASSDNQDLFKAMQLAAGLYKDRYEDAELIPAESAVEMATLRGARAVGLEREIGSIEVGKRADLILLNQNAPELTPLLDVANAIVYATDGRNVDTVIVDGQILMESRRVLTIDEEALYAEVRRASPRLLERAGVRPQPRWRVL